MCCALLFCCCCFLFVVCNMLQFSIFQTKHCRTCCLSGFLFQLSCRGSIGPSTHQIAQALDATNHLILTCVDCAVLWFTERMSCDLMVNVCSSEPFLNPSACISEPWELVAFDISRFRCYSALCVSRALAPRAPPPHFFFHGNFDCRCHNYSWEGEGCRRHVTGWLFLVVSHSHACERVSLHWSYPEWTTSKRTLAPDRQTINYVSSLKLPRGFWTKFRSTTPNHSNLNQFNVEFRS